jgi:sugar-specific transcriptional regulator TrmB
MRHTPILWNRMSASDEHVSTLVGLGLSPSQARVYLALVKQRNLTAQTISAISGVARPDVYRVLGELEEAGLVEKTISKPENFHAVPVEECVSTLLQRRIRKTGKLQKEALKLAQAFREKTASEEPREEFEFVLIPEGDAVYIKAEKTIRNTQECICFLGLTRRTLSWLSKYLPDLQEALARKVVCRMILPDLGESEAFRETIKILRRYPDFALRLIPGSPKTAFSVWDRKEILVTTSTIDSPTPAATLWSNNKSIVDLCQEFFDCLWRKADESRF